MRNKSLSVEQTEKLGQILGVPLPKEAVDVEIEALSDQELEDVVGGASATEPALKIRFKSLGGKPGTPRWSAKI